MKLTLFVLSSLLLAVGCGGHNPPNPPVPPNPIQYSLQVQVTPSIEGVTIIIIDNQNKDRQELTDRDGHVFFPTLIGPTAFTVCARKNNYHEKCVPIQLLDANSAHQTTIIEIQPLVTARLGQVTADRFSLVDGSGRFLGFGTSLFWGLWGYEHDLARLKQNLQTARDADIDYLRVFAIVGPSHWTNRTVNPRDPNWQANIARFTNLAYDDYGIRVEWVIFAGLDNTPSEGDRIVARDKFLSALSGIEHKVWGIEIANEAWNIGFNKPTELKAHAIAIRSKFPGLVATTSPQGLPCNAGESEQSCYCRAQAIWYSGNETYITQHFDRAQLGNLWRPIRQPWRGSAFSCMNAPRLYSNDEDIGPQSSVAADDDPLRLSMLAATSYTSGIATYTLHTGAGIQGGGVEDLARGRVANLWEVKNWKETTTAINYIRNQLDPNLPNWHKGTSNPSLFTVQSFPVNNAGGTVDRVYCADEDNHFTCSVLNIHGNLKLIPKRNMSWKVIDPSAQTINTGIGTIAISTPAGVVIQGNTQ